MSTSKQNKKQQKKNNTVESSPEVEQVSTEPVVAPEEVQQQLEVAQEPEQPKDLPEEKPVEDKQEEVQPQVTFSEEEVKTTSAPDELASLPYADRVEQVLQGLGNGEKPWFLSTAEIYKTAKDTVSTIPKGKDLFDQSLSSLSQLTKQINSSTKMNVAFEVDQSYELIGKLDSMLADNLIVLDDGLDDMRAQLSSNLRQLIVAVIQHKNWAETYANRTKTMASDSLHTRYEQALDMLKKLVKEVEKRFPVAYAQVSMAVQHSYNNVEKAANFTYDCAGMVTETVDMVYHEGLNKIHTTIEDGKNKVVEIQNKIDETVFEWLFFSLKTAQPLVHNVVERTVPYLNQAIIVSKPLLDQAKPFVEPIVHKAVDVNSNLKDNKMIGSYVSKANDVGFKFVHETINFCIPASVEIASF